MAVGSSADQVLGVELGLAEELLAALSLQSDQAAQDDTYCGRAETAEFFEVGFTLLGGQILHDLFQVGEVEQRKPSGVGVVEHQPQAGLLGLVQTQHLAQQDRSEAGDGGAQRHPAALSPKA